MSSIPSRKPTRSRGVEELEAFVRFAENTLTTEDGTPFVVEPFQRTILADFFAGAREEVILLPKKNGKSSLMGALAIWHLLTVPFAEAIIVAAARDQAGIVLRQVEGFIRRSRELRVRLKVVQREVRNGSLGGRLRVLASDSDTVDGVLPTLAIVDELHRHRRAELYGLLRDGLGPRDGQVVAISTAGDSEDTPLGRLRATAYRLPGLVRDGAHRHVSTGSFSFHEWKVDDDADVHDLELVKAANPLTTVEELRQRHNSPSMTEWAWKRFACGIWTSGEYGAIQPLEWAKCADRDLVVPPDARGPFIGLDCGWKWDTTAIVPVWIVGSGWREERREVRPGVFSREWVQDGTPPMIYVGTPTVIVPPQDGNSLSVDVVFDACRQMGERWEEPTFVVDPMANGEHVAQRLDAELGMRVVIYSQSNQPMMRASQRLTEAVTAVRLRHPDDETLTQHVLNAGVKQIAEGWRLVKQNAKSPIDACVAMAMAISAGIDDAGGDEPPELPPGGYRAVGFRN